MHIVGIVHIEIQEARLEQNMLIEIKYQNLKIIREYVLLW